MGEEALMQEEGTPHEMATRMLVTTEEAEAEIGIITTA